MRIRRLSITNFNRFEDLEVALEPGLNLIVGPNESGKSTIVDAIVTALYVDVTSKARALGSHVRWGVTGGFKIELDFEDGDEAYRLLKDFGARRAQLTVVDAGDIITDSGAIDDRLGRIVGFATAEAFVSVACARQGELAVLEVERSAGKRARESLVPLIQRKMTSSSGEVDGAEVVRRIDEAMRSIKRGVGGTAKRPGRLRQLMDSKGELARKIEEASGKWTAVLEARAQVSQEREKLREAEEKLGRGRTAIEAQKQWEEKKRQRDGGGDIAGVVDRLGEVQNSIGEIRRLSADLSRARAELASVRQQDLEHTEELKGRLALLTHGSEDTGRGTARADRTGSPARLRVLGVLCAASSGALAVLAAVLGSRGAGAAVLVAAACAAGLAAFLLLRRAGERLAIEKLRAIEERQRQETRTNFQDALERLGLSSHREFERLLITVEEARTQVATSQALLTELCSGDTPKVAEEKLHAKAAGLERQKKELDTFLNDEERGATLLPPGDFRRLLSTREGLEQTVDELKTSIARNEGRLERVEEGESLPRLRAESEIVEAELATLERRLRELELARSGIDEAVASTKAEAASVLAPRIAEILSRVTLGRYARVSVQEDLGFGIVNPIQAAGAPPVLSRGELSEGTADQLHLAARLALLDLIAGPGRCPFILDDALVSFDPQRRLRALDVLREAGWARQVLLFSCINPGAEWAASVIELPGVVNRTRGGDV